MKSLLGARKAVLPFEDWGAGRLAVLGASSGKASAEAFAVQRRMGVYMLRHVPLIGLIIIFYNVLVFAGAMVIGDWQGMHVFLDSKLFPVHMVSGETWEVTTRDGVILLGLLALFQEIVRATGFSRVTIVNHALSMGVFVLALVEFLILKGFATSTFFIIMIMALIDVIAGFTISIVAARRDVGFQQGMFGVQ